MIFPSELNLHVWLGFSQFAMLNNQMVVETPKEALAKNPVVRREPFGAMGDPYGDFMGISD